MKKNMTNRQKQAIETKHKIYNTSIHLFEKYGFQNVHIKDICNHAHISIGTFYHYYKSKHDVFYEIYTRADDYFQTTIRNELKEEYSPDRIVEFFHHYAQYNISTGLDTLKQMLSTDNKNYIKKGRSMQKLLMNIIEDGQHKGEINTNCTPEDICETLFIIARGIVFDWGLHDGNYDLKDKMKELIEPFVKMNLKS